MDNIKIDLRLIINNISNYNNNILINIKKIYNHDI